MLKKVLYSRYGVLAEIRRTSCHGTQQEGGLSMLTTMKHGAAMIAACILGLYLSPACAEDALAYGQFNATLGCDKTP
jgi:hypothetical protein